MSILNFLRLKNTTDDIDSPEATIRNSFVIQQKPFLKNVYKNFYVIFKETISPIKKKSTIVELGSGGGFIKEILPNVITSDILKLPTVDQSFSALKIPWKDSSIDAFLMINVLHHLKNPNIFFREANRCLKVGGKVVMIEPASTYWGRFFYKNFHYEPYDKLADWKILKKGPLSGANDALPWIIFFRDRKIFQKKYKSLKINTIETHTPFSFILSGGTTYKQLVPSKSYTAIRIFEKVISPLNRYLGMFYTIELEKIN